MFKSEQFKSVRSRLLLSYLGVMSATLGISFFAVERWVVYDLNQQFNDYLFELAETASQTLEIVKHEYYEEKEEEENEEPYEHNYPATYPKLADLMAEYNRHGTLVVPKHHPLYYAQGVEWFDEKQQTLVREGDLAVKWPLSDNLAKSDTIVERNHIRSIALPVYYTAPNSTTKELSGYIRTSHITEVLDTQLTRLRWGLGIGGVVALGLTTGGALWLTTQSLKPIAESFARLKQFTADASHELRSPLTTIKSSISVLQTHPERIHPADKNKVTAISDASDRMARLVEDLLLLARLDGSIAIISLEKIPLPLDEILEDTIEFARPEAEKKQITLEEKLHSEVWVVGEGRQLQRVFANLIENAIQYTPVGGKVKVSLSTNGTETMVTVEDTGIGIAPEDLPHIFERLWRSDQARAKRREGTGLGMAIAQTLIQVHGGKIEVTSELGVGSCFRVLLPTVQHINKGLGSTEPGDFLGQGSRMQGEF